MHASMKTRTMSHIEATSSDGHIHKKTITTLAGYVSGIGMHREEVI
jgi:hypothetical protein